MNLERTSIEHNIEIYKTFGSSNTHLWEDGQTFELLGLDCVAVDTIQILGFSNNGAVLNAIIFGDSITIPEQVVQINASFGYSWEIKVSGNGQFKGDILTLKYALD